MYNYLKNESTVAFLIIPVERRQRYKCIKKPMSVEKINGTVKVQTYKKIDSGKMLVKNG